MEDKRRISHAVIRCAYPDDKHPYSIIDYIKMAESAMKRIEENPSSNMRIIRSSWFDYMFDPNESVDINDPRGEHAYFSKIRKTLENIKESSFVTKEDDEILCRAGAPSRFRLNPGTKYKK